MTASPNSGSITWINMPDRPAWAGIGGYVPNTLTNKLDFVTSGYSQVIDRPAGQYFNAGEILKQQLK